MKPTSTIALVNENGLTSEQQAQANALADLIPGFRKLASDIVALEDKRANKYYLLCQRIRSEKFDLGAGEKRTMNRREVNLMLHGLGFPKQRRTEINRIIECPQSVWDQLTKKMVTFREALKLTRSADAPPASNSAKEATGDGSAEGGEQGGSPSPEKPVKPTSLALPPEWQNAITVSATEYPLKEDKKLSYLFSYLNAGGLRYTVAIYVDKVTT